MSGAWFQVLDSSRIRVYWTGLPEPNGVVTRYVITYYAKDPTWNHHSGRQTQENENAKQLILTGLNAYTTYAINIYPVNGAGWGENSRLVAQTREARELMHICQVCVGRTVMYSISGAAWDAVWCSISKFTVFPSPVMCALLGSYIYCTFCPQAAYVPGYCWPLYL